MLPNNEDPNTDDYCVPVKKRRLRSDRKKYTTKSIRSKRRSSPEEIPLDVIVPMKRLKLEQDPCPKRHPIVIARPSEVPPTESKTVQNSKTFNFITACHRVSSDYFYDIRKRFSLINLPECCFDLSECQRRHKEQSANCTVLSHEAESFNIDYNAKMISEALKVCRTIVKFNKYPSVDMMFSLVEIILHSHGDGKSESIDHRSVLQECSACFKFFFNTHPPCSKPMRRHYLNFLTKPYDRDDPKIVSSIYRQSNDGLFVFVIRLLEEELDTESDDPIIDVAEFKNINGGEITIQEANILKNKYEIYDSHERHHRIERLMMVLEIIVDLLERDLGIWLKKNINNSYKMMLGNQKPLIAHLIWQQNPFYTGTVNDKCFQIFKLFVKLKKLNYPDYHIKTISRLVNLNFNIFHACEDTTNNFPNFEKYANNIANEMFDIIEDEPLPLIVDIVSTLNSESFKYILSSAILKKLLRSSEENILNVVLGVFQNESWKTFKKSKVKLRNYKEKSTEDNNILYSGFFGKLKRKSDRGAIDKNSKGKKNKSPNCEKGDDYHFLLLLHQSLKSFLVIHNIEEIQKEYNRLNNSHASEPSKVKTESVVLHLTTESPSEKYIVSKFNETIKVKKTERVSDLRAFKMNEKCVKYYRAIFQTLKQIAVSYYKAKNTLPFDLFCDINVIQC